MAMTADGAVQRPTMAPSSSSDDDLKRWRINIKHVAIIDLETVMQFSRPDEGVPNNEEACLTGKLGWMRLELRRSAHGD